MLPYEYLEPSTPPLCKGEQSPGGNAGHGCARERSRHGSRRDRSEYRTGERSPKLPQGHSRRGIGCGRAGRPCRQPCVDGPRARAAGISRGGLAQALPHSRLGPDGALGYFSKSLALVVEVITAPPGSSRCMVGGCERCPAVARFAAQGRARRHPTVSDASGVPFAWLAHAVKRRRVSAPESDSISRGQG